MNKTERGMRRYFIELNLVLLLFAALLLSRRWAPAGDIKTALQVASVIPFWLGALVVMRLFRAMDEYGRQQSLLCAAIGGGITMLLILSYKQLQVLGLPPITTAWTWIIMGTACGICGMVFGWRDYVSRVGVSRGVKWAAMTVTIIAAPTLLYALVAPVLGWPHRPGVLILLATMIFLALNAYAIFVKRCQE